LERQIDGIGPATYCLKLHLKLSFQKKTSRMLKGAIGCLAKIGRSIISALAQSNLVTDAARLIRSNAVIQSGGISGVCGLDLVEPMQLL
jgi:hypothetical protein